MDELTDLADYIRVVRDTCERWTRESDLPDLVMTGTDDSGTLLTEWSRHARDAVGLHGCCNHRADGPHCAHKDVTSHAQNLTSQNRT